MQCLCCQKETKNPKYCSKSCAVKSNNANFKKKNIIVNCQNCGIEITGRHRLVQKYCSRKCMGIKTKEITNHKFLDGKIQDQSSIRNVINRIKEHRCEICGITDWCNKPMILLVDHIDGNANNNDITNLRLICSNCDSQLPTYKSKNKGSGRHYRKTRYHNGQSY
jgi:hypothetical protein